MYFVNSKIVRTFAPSKFKKYSTMSNTEKKQPLKTITVKGGQQVLDPAPIDYCGMWEFSQVDNYHNALTDMLQYKVCFICENYYTGQSSIDGINNAFLALSDVSRFKEDYLKRRIEQLEEALGLSHNRDIDTGRGNNE